MGRLVLIPRFNFHPSCNFASTSYVKKQEENRLFLGVLTSRQGNHFELHLN
jgi:hypothetical protein